MWFRLVLLQSHHNYSSLLTLAYARLQHCMVSFALFNLLNIHNNISTDEEKRGGFYKRGASYHLLKYGLLSVRCLAGVSSAGILSVLTDTF